MKNQQNPATITARELQRKLDAGEPLLLVDVRDPDEYADWNIDGSVNVPLTKLENGAPLVTPDNGEVVTVCAHGFRSEKARDALANRGIPARSLDGGMVAWNTVYETVPVETKDGNTVLQFRRLGKGCLSYMIVSGDEAAVVDPTLDVDVYVDAAKERGVRITKLLDTHAHADHVSGGRDLAKATGAEYHAPDEVPPAVPHTSVQDGDSIGFGEAKIQAIHTPGHTSHSMTYRVGDVILTGDTLFVESVGRPDLGQDVRPNAGTLYDTLHGKLMPLPDDGIVLPGHYGDGVDLRKGSAVQARLGDLKENLRALKMTRDEFVEWAAGNTLPKPGNFLTVKQYNKGEVTIDDPEELRELEAGPNRCAVSG